MLMKTINLKADGPRSIPITTVPSTCNGSTIKDAHGRRVSLVSGQDPNRCLITVPATVCAPAGSVILWESRTIHYGAAPKEGANPRYATCESLFKSALQFSADLTALLPGNQ